MSFWFSAFGVVLALYIATKIIVFICDILIKVLDWLTLKNIFTTIGTFAVLTIVVAILMHVFPV